MRAEVAVPGTGSLSHRVVAVRRDGHMAQFPRSTSQQSVVLGLLEPEVVALCLTALDGFLSSCLLLPLACIYAEEQAQKEVAVSCYTPARRNRKWVSTPEVRMFPDFSISNSHYNSSI